jgi:hypothetical protein
MLSFEDAETIFKHLYDICGVRALSFVLPDLVFELANDGRTYEPGALPTRLRGWVIIYHRDLGGNSLWKDALPMIQNGEYGS